MHENLSNTIQRSKDELVEHESNHDWLGTAVRGRNSQSGIEMERRKEGFVVDKQTEGGECECEVQLGDSEKLSGMGYMISFEAVKLIKEAYRSTNVPARDRVQPLPRMRCSAQ